MSGNTELKHVWVQLYIGDDPNGNAFELEAQRNVGALAEAVWGKRETRLRESSGARDASELKVYTSATAEPIPDGAEALAGNVTVPSPVTYEAPLIVKAEPPPTQPPDGKLRFCSCSCIQMLLRVRK